VQKFWSILFAAVNLAALGLFVIAPLMHGLFGINWWLPKDVSAPGFGSGVDALYYWILGVTGFFFVLTEALLVWAMWRYAAAPGRASWYVHGNHTLEWFWTIVPGAILVIIGLTQVRTWEAIKYKSHMPDPEQVVEVSARQFEWRIRYPTTETNVELTHDWKGKKTQARVKAWDDVGEADDVRIVNELHTWKGAKVRVFLKTRDVIHSFFLPNMRLKQDALPGKMIPVWLETAEHNVEWDEAKHDWDVKENWELACAELCGWGHYKMQGRFFVHKDKAEFDRWLKQMQDRQSARDLPKANEQDNP
jgi:cytochrome c oxidase subunit 2